MVYKTFLTHTGVYYGGMRDGAAYGLLTEVNELAAQGVHAGSAEIRIYRKSGKRRSVCGF